MMYLSRLLQFLVLLPAAALCFLPVHNHLRLSRTRTGIYNALLFLILIPTLAAVSVGTGLVFYQLLFPATVFLFASLCFFVASSPAKSLVVVLLSMTIMTYPANISHVIDALLHPTENISDLCLVSAGMQLGFCFLFASALGYFYFCFLGKLIDELEDDRVWLITAPVPLIFLIINVVIQPKYNETLYIHRILFIYIMLLICSFILLMILSAFFYLVAMNLLQGYESAERIRSLEIQEYQYRKKLQCMEQISTLRNDFLQSIQTVQTLAKDENPQALRAFLDRFSGSLLSAETSGFCKNPAANAVLNHYAAVMDKEQIRRNWSISLPDTLYISDAELCGLISTLLDNVLAACLSVPPEQRYHHFMIRLLHEDELYLVSSNSFNGVVRMKRGEYMSTSHDGAGIGLSSMRATAEAFGGSARFAHTDNRFITDLVLKNCSVIHSV